MIATDNSNNRIRSRTMAAIKSSGNRSTEQKLIVVLENANITGWRVQAKDLIGKPDFVFDDKKLAIFVDGCFWHGCRKCYRRPHSSTEYWDEKVLKNIRRDKQVAAKLRRNGWKVIRIWEHSLSRPEKVINRIKNKLDTQLK